MSQKHVTIWKRKLWGLKGHCAMHRFKEILINVYNDEVDIEIYNREDN